MCVILNSFSHENGNDLFIAKLIPAIHDTGYAAVAGPVEKVLLSARHAGHPVLNAKDFPVCVYVTYVTDHSVFVNRRLEPEQGRYFLWGELFASREAAEAFSNEWWDRPRT